MPRPEVSTDFIEEFAGELERLDKTLPDRINADPEKVEQGLARLVLAIVDLVRRLLEKQAIRRIEGGSLSDEQVERLGETFMKLEARMGELRKTFGLKDSDLDLKLGPIEDLM